MKRYNFIGGNAVEYLITAMIGGVVGRSNGVAPGLLLNFKLNKAGLYSEVEYLLDVDSRANNFFYSWTDLTWSLNDRLWIGLSAQRTRLYETSHDVQRGLLIRGGLKKWQFTGYVYNLGFDDPFVILTLSVSF
ncbi:MAG: hypothetical protein KF687_18020 [Cyclobacteriaceae bacterium]|nr:hypothetical protein [Cyclobacteriaceae bacterium]